MLYLFSVFTLFEPVSPRIVGMGTAFTTASGGVTSLFWNPAGMMGDKGVVASGFSFCGINWFEGGYSFPAGRLTVGIGVKGMFSGEMDALNEDADMEGKFSWTSFAPVGGFSWMIDPDFYVGVGLKPFYEKVSNFTSYGISMDAGMIRIFPLGEKEVFLGLLLKDMGYRIKPFVEEKEYHYEIRAGLGYLAEKLFFSLEYSYPYGVAAGLSWRVSSLLAFSFGYNHLYKETGTGSGMDIFNGITMGMEFLKDNYSLEFSFNPMGVLGPAVRGGVVYMLR
ncbi:hypothetical protein DRQ18_05735 [bacterium]|nr:MAG: hypothetical protein DRQ18_05735 [bacterium]